MFALWLTSWTAAAKRWAGELMAVLIALAVGAALGAGVTLALIEKARADKAVKAPEVCTPVTTVIHDAAVAASASASAEEKIDHVETHVAVAQASAVAAVDAAPQPSCHAADLAPGLDAWRSGIDGVRRAAASGEP
jgi:hypothetical protein